MTGTFLFTGTISIGTNGCILCGVGLSQLRRSVMSDLSWTEEAQFRTSNPYGVGSKIHASWEVAVEAEEIHSFYMKNILHYPIFKSDVVDFNSSSTSHLTKCIF